MLLKAVEQSRYVNSEHVAVYKVNAAGDDWVVAAYLTTGNFASAGAPVQLSLAYDTEAEANEALDKLMAALGVLDLATIT